MSAEAAALRRVARLLAEDWQRVAPRACLLLGGSLAAGRADSFSDLDLHLITSEPLPAALRHERLHALADPGSLNYRDQPVRTGGLSDTFRVAGRDVTICFRTTAAVDEAIASLLRGEIDTPDHEAAYGHELLGAEILADPLGLAAGWQDRLRHYPARRRERLVAELTGRLAAAALIGTPFEPRTAFGGGAQGLAPGGAVALGVLATGASQGSGMTGPGGGLPPVATLFAPAVAWALQRLYAREGRWFGGAKRRPPDTDWSPTARAALAALEAIVTTPGPLSPRLVALAGGAAAPLLTTSLPDGGAFPTASAPAAAGASVAALAAALAVPDLPAEQWANLGSDALGGRLEVALARSDPFGTVHYLGRAVAALAALGDPPDGSLWSLPPPTARHHLAARLHERLQSTGLLTSYAETALRQALG